MLSLLSVIFYLMTTNSAPTSHSPINYFLFLSLHHLYLYRIIFHCPPCTEFLLLKIKYKRFDQIRLILWTTVRQKLFPMTNSIPFGPFGAVGKKSPMDHVFFFVSQTRKLEIIFTVLHILPLSLQRFIQLFFFIHVETSFNIEISPNYFDRFSFFSYFFGFFLIFFLFLTFITMFVV